MWELLDLTDFVNESMFDEIPLAFDGYSEEPTDSHSEGSVALSGSASSVTSDSSLLPVPAVLLDAADASQAPLLEEQAQSTNENEESPIGTVHAEETDVEDGKCFPKL